MAQTATVDSSAGWLRVFGITTRGVKYRSQVVAYPYFMVGAVLFLLQIVFGLIIAAQYVWPTLFLDSLPFNIGRATHLNLLIFWLLLGLMGATYYLIPEEVEREIFSVPLAYVQLGVMVFAGLATMASFWFLPGWSLGKPFTESPMPWPYFIALGAVLFLVNVGITIIQSKRWTAISVIVFGGMAGISVLYLIDLIFFANLTMDYYFWWWIIHLWVEGTWEMVAAAIMAFVLLKLTGVDRSRMAKYLYAEVALTLFTGIIGTGHHYYWIGTPAYWLWLGAIFSAFEPIPIALMVYDALMDMRHRRIEPVNRVAMYYVIGSAFGHFVGAAVWGFAQTLPQINQWTHGTQVTASHGHAAFFGAYAMTVIAAVYLMVPSLRNMTSIAEARGKLGFWLMSAGMCLMVAAFSIAGVVQVYLWRVLGLDFMTVRTQYESFWMFWVFAFGLLVFTPGLLVYLWDFFGLRTAPSAAPKPAMAGATR